MNEFRREKKQPTAAGSRLKHDNEDEGDEERDGKMAEPIRNDEYRKAKSGTKQLKSYGHLYPFSRASSLRSDDEAHEPLTRSPKQDVLRNTPETQTRAEAPQDDSFVLPQARMTARVICAFYVVDLLVLCILRAIWLAEKIRRVISEPLNEIGAVRREDWHLHSNKQLGAHHKQIGAHHHRLAEVSAEF